MKKRSFFERLTGNISFDENEEDGALPPQKGEQSVPKRELKIEGSAMSAGSEILNIHEEEVGELPIDLYETPNEVIVQTLIAGVMPENLTINITRDTLTVSGRREENKTITKENYHVNELYWGAFTRSVTLPAEVDIDLAEAIERHGMLMIKLPKLDRARKANLKVKSI